VILTTTAHTEGSEYTLTVNGVTDASAAKNAIAANSTAAYTFIVELDITNISKANYRAAIRNPNDSIYVDRDYRFSQFWPDYQQDHYLVILTANNEKSSTGTSFLSFDVNMNVEVRIGIAGGSPLSWMDGWTNTGQTVTAHTTFTMYSKTFPAGTVTLGGNEGSGSNMYTVFVTPDQGPPVIQAGNSESAIKSAVLNAVPNPFKPSTVFRFYLQKKQPATLKIFNPQGVLVAVLMDGKMVQGRQAVKWSGTGLNSGMYVAKLEAGSKVSIKKVMFLK
jgi:membrane-bound inhibitor of C-type lysozyme